ncbi:MAG: 2Fe-2S iron-sulfur cluster-binding protein [Candidatus Bathyarchaeia archaeon]
MKLTIDGKETEAPPGATLLEAARKLGVEIPTLCYFPGIFNETTCRICLVQLVKPGRMVSSCAYPVSEGLVVETDNEAVRRARRLSLELILASHVAKCQSCPRKGGNCELLKLSREYGVEGIPVCSECSLHEEDCLLSRGQACLGPLTVAGCNGVCMREGRICEGCRGPVTAADVVREGMGLYEAYSIDMSEVRRKTSKYYGSSADYGEFVRLVNEVAAWK